jgi:ribosome biogenesis GTPase A
MHFCRPFGCELQEGTAEDFVRGIADRLFFGDVEKAGARLLKDYRTGLLGSFALELPEDIDDKRRREEEADAAREAKEAAREAAKRTGKGF